VPGVELKSERQRNIPRSLPLERSGFLVGSQSHTQLTTGKARSVVMETDTGAGASQLRRRI
jgi:hypothetical protein